MRYDNSTAGRQLTLVLEEFELPTDETERDQFLDDLETALEDVLTEHEIGAERLRAIGGHSYSAIDDCCPVCGNDLKLIAPSLDSHNGAYARARCECGWAGEAVYRLIDFHESSLGSDDHNSADDDEPETARFNENSSVSLHDLELRYYPY